MTHKGNPARAESPTPSALTANPAELVASIERAEPGGEDRLVESYGRAIRLILDRQTGGRPEAQDLFQETFLIALQKLRAGELRDPNKLAAFLGQIARNLTIEHFRKKSRRKTEADSEAVDRTVGAAPGQLDRLSRSENASIVREVIEELSNHRDRELLFRFYIAEEDKDVLSTEFGLTSLQFNRVLHRARRRYKERFLERQPTFRPGTLFLLLWGAIFSLLGSQA